MDLRPSGEWAVVDTDMMGRVYSTVLFLQNFGFPIYGLKVAMVMRQAKINHGYLETVGIPEYPGLRSRRLFVGLILPSSVFGKTNSKGSCIKSFFTCLWGL